LISKARTSPYLAAVGASLVIASIAIGTSARVSALAAVIAILALWLSTRRTWGINLACISALTVSASVLLLEHATSVLVLVAAGSLVPVVAIVEAAASLARAPGRPTLPPTLTILRLASVISGSLACCSLMAVVSSSNSTLRLDPASQLRLVSAVGWLLLPVALVVPWLASEPILRLRVPGVATLCGIVAALAAAAGLIDGIAPIRLAVGAAVGAGLAWLGQRPATTEVADEQALESTTFLKLAVGYAVSVTTFLGCVTILTLWT
jgi:hypothetical protein